MVSLYSPGCPRTSSADHAVLKLRDLPTGIKGMNHHAWLSTLNFETVSLCDPGVPLSLLTGCSTWEGGPHALTGQHNGADSCEPAPKA